MLGMLANRSQFCSGETRAAVATVSELNPWNLFRDKFAEIMSFGVQEYALICSSGWVGVYLSGRSAGSIPYGLYHTMKCRSLVQTLFATTLTLVVFCSGIGYFGSEQPAIAAPPAGSILPSTTKFVPQAAPVMVSLLGRSSLPKPLLGESQGSVPSPAAAQLLQLPYILLQSADIDYPTDLQPWISDEVTFALTDPDRSPTPRYLFVAVTRDAKNSQELLDHLWQQQVAAGQQLQFEQYKGVSLIATDRSPPPPADQTATSGLTPFGTSFPTLATAIYADRYVLITNGVEGLHQVIDTVQAPELSLNQFADYQLALDTLGLEPFWGFTFVNFATLQHPPPQAAATSPQPYRSAAIALSSPEDELLADTLLVADPAQPVPAVEPTVTEAIQALNYIPPTSPFVLAGVDLNHLWPQISHAIMANPQVKQWVTQSLAQGGKRWGMEPLSALFPLIEGEYAVALLPSPPGSETPSLNAKPKPEWLFVNALPQGNAAGQPLTQKLQSLAQEQQIGISPFQLGAQAVAAWTQVVNQPAQARGSTVLNAAVAGAFATVADHKILATSLDALEQSLVAPKYPLADTEDFQRAIAPFERPNQGYLYLDWPGMRSRLERQLPQLHQLEQTVPELFQRLKTVSISNYGETPQVQHSQILFRLTHP